MGWIGHSPRTGSLRRAAMVTARLTYSTPRPVLPHRLDLPLLLNRRRLLGCGVEIGVKGGEYSQLLLKTWRGRHLISVDPWLEAPTEEYVDIANVHQAKHDDYYQQTLGRLRPFGDRSTVWRMMGGDAAERIPDHCLDFAYLDARHDYEAVMQDLEEWIPKVRPGGVLAGHDYIDGDFEEGAFGVKSAVDEFFADRHGRVSATFADPPWRSWYAVVQ
jgi:hypothetical protein